ncbi:MAG: TIGR03905 family TSCPD domain-containing protein [Candidatus Izemoplasmatales bacterium]|jgi:uncharacterized protein (TIGR03905 family)|nr:TIGR03905 family TSCPD domain-containing protein [Candidatus Izemoplasmatales bacterium]MDD4595253.1 TIGR03905 family TSCPD domain-containing protein [Candidatus Izemoplasmatales bacterium]
MKHITFLTKNVCSVQIDFDLTDTLQITNCHFTGGCSGNLLAISKLIENHDALSIASILKGNHCGSNSTSCADQLAIAIIENIE